MISISVLSLLDTERLSVASVLDALLDNRVIFLSTFTQEPSLYHRTTGLAYVLLKLLVSILPVVAAHWSTTSQVVSVALWT
jgi:hypothetical protein